MAPDLKHADTHLRIEQRAPGDLASAKRTPRRRSKKAQAQLEASIRAFGFNAPVLIGPDDVIVAGHARVAAALISGHRARHGRRMWRGGDRYRRLSTRQLLRRIGAPPDA